MLKRDFFPELAKEHGLQQEFNEQVKVSSHLLRKACALSLDLMTALMQFLKLCNFYFSRFYARHASTSVRVVSSREAFAYVTALSPLSPHACALQQSINRSIEDYDRVADLEFALMVWRQNLKRDLLTTSSLEVR